VFGNYLREDFYCHIPLVLFMVIQGGNA